jgi:hypothetical protein
MARDRHGEGPQKEKAPERGLFNDLAAVACRHAQPSSGLTRRAKLRVGLAMYGSLVPPASPPKQAISAPVSRHADRNDAPARHGVGLSFSNLISGMTP